jgi:hypothetical protein
MRYRLVFEIEQLPENLTVQWLLHTVQDPWCDVCPKTPEGLPVSWTLIGHGPAETVKVTL